MSFVIFNDWIPKIDKLCTDFQKIMRVNLGGHYVWYKKDYIGTISCPGVIIQEYYKSVRKFNKKTNLEVETLGTNPSMNYYLFAAFFIRAFLLYPPFYSSIPNYFKKRLKLKYANFINEQFIIAFLEAVFQVMDTNSVGELILDKENRNKLINKMVKYKFDINLLKPEFFANEIYYIKQEYFS